MNKTKNITHQSLKSYVEHAYLDYAMYVILDRALPHISDGLKPVQRRIIYAMLELHLTSNAKYKKSARTVGDVIGKFHPHGDAAAYEAMVIMAQDFSYRYPLVDGQGNWGSLDDPKSFAAMRYTEARLSAYARNLLSELGQGTVKWVDNFDGTLKEPLFLPAQLPNILLNGASGIAVGMSTDIPPHNLTEVVGACICLLEKPNSTIENILEYISAPDYPTRANIISTKEEIANVYATGKGSIVQRSTWDKKKSQIIIHALPYQVPVSRVLQQIAVQIKNKLPQVLDLRDESDHENDVRLVLELKSSKVEAEQIMLHLFASTDLERSHRVNLNVIDSTNSPRVMDLKSICVEWLEFRKNMVKNRLQYRLDTINKRLHLLDGLIIVFLNLDRVIEVVRNEDYPKKIIMLEFSLTEEQANYILETKLRQLAKLEEYSIKKEHGALQEERKKITVILSSDNRLVSVIKKELKALDKEFGGARISNITTESITKAEILNAEQVLPNEPVTFILSEHGWARLAKGHQIDAQGLKFKTGDNYLTHQYGMLNNKIVLLDNKGKSYSFFAHTLPSARSLGEPITSYISPSQDANITHALLPRPEENILFVSSVGYGFIAPVEQLYTNKKAGRKVVTLKDNSLILAKPVASGDRLVLISSDGKLLILEIDMLPILNKGLGKRLIQLDKGSTISAIKVIKKDDGIKLFTAGNRGLNLVGKDIENYLGKPARRGLKLPKGFSNISKIEKK